MVIVYTIWCVIWYISTNPVFSSAKAPFAERQTVIFWARGFELQRRLAWQQNFPACKPQPAICGLTKVNVSSRWYTNLILLKGRKYVQEQSDLHPSRLYFRFVVSHYSDVTQNWFDVKRKENIARVCVCFCNTKERNPDLFQVNGLQDLKHVLHVFVCRMISWWLRAVLE